MIYREARRCDLLPKLPSSTDGANAYSAEPPAAATLDGWRPRLRNPAFFSLCIFSPTQPNAGAKIAPVRLRAPRGVSPSPALSRPLSVPDSQSQLVISTGASSFFFAARRVSRAAREASRFRSREARQNLHMWPMMWPGPGPFKKVESILNPDSEASDFQYERSTVSIFMIASFNLWFLLQFLYRSCKKFQGKAPGQQPRELKLCQAVVNFRFLSCRLFHRAGCMQAPAHPRLNRSSLRVGSVLRCTLARPPPPSSGRQ